MNVNLLIKVWVVFVMTIGSFFVLRPGMMTDPVTGNGYGPFMFYSKYHGDAIDKIPAQWRSRQVACFLTKWLLELLKPKTFADFAFAFGLYNSVWFSASLIVLLIDKNNLLVFLGVFMALVCNTMPNFVPYVLPWDMPELFFFTLCFVLYRSKHWLAMMIAILIGSLFKETVLVCSLFFLAAPYSAPMRWLSIAMLCVVSQMVNKGLAPAGEPISWTLTLRLPPFSNVFKLWPIPFANAGSLSVLFYLLAKNKELPLLLACLAFVCAQCFNDMVWGVYAEFREWTCLAPITFCLLENFRTAADGKNPYPSTGEFVGHLKENQREDKAERLGS